MKTKQLLFLGILGLSSLLGNAQATSVSTTNTVSATDYLGSGTSSDYDVVFKRHGINAGLLSSSETTFGLNTSATNESVSFGNFAGGSNINGMGIQIGYNSYIGYKAGYSDNNYGGVGQENSFLGHFAGHNSFGDGNVSIGKAAGAGLEGSANTSIGHTSGAGSVGDHNIFIGYNAGSDLTGNNNIILGHNEGNLAIDNQLIINNEQTETNPLIWGDFADNQLKFNGKVGVGYGFAAYPSTAGSVDVSAYNLFVTGGILTDEVRVSTTWADYVFAKEYKLPSLNEVEKHIQEKGHLMNVPSAKQVEQDGIELGEMAKIQQEKIEELTLYIIEQNKINEAQNKIISELAARLNAVEKR